LNYLQTIEQNLATVEHYIAWQDTISELRKFLADPRIKEAIQGKAKREFYKDEKGMQNYVLREIDDYIKRLARGRIETVNADRGVNKFLRFFRGNFVTMVLGFNLSTMLKQPVSFIQGLASVNKIHALRSTFDFVRHPFEFNAFVNSKSVMMKNRGNSFERIFAEQFEKSQLHKIYGMKAKWKGVKDFSMLGIKIADKITTDILWYAKYSEIMNDAADEELAIKQADRVIRKSQPMGGLVHLPSVYMGSEWMRMLTMFTNQLNQNFNLQWEMKNTWKGKTVTRKAEELALYIAVPTLMIYLITKGFRWRDLKDDPEGVVTQMVMNTFGGVPGLNMVAELVMEGLGNLVRTKVRGGKAQRYFAKKIIPAQILNMVLYGAKDLWDVTMGGKELKSSDIKKITELIGITTGAPIGAPSRAIKGAKKSLEAFRQGQYIEGIRRLIWSEYALRDMSIENDMTKRLKSTKPEEVLAVRNYMADMTPEERAKFTEFVKDSPTFKEFNRKRVEDERKPMTIKKFMDKPKTYLGNRIVKLTGKKVSKKDIDRNILIIKSFTEDRREARSFAYSFFRKKYKSYSTRKQRMKRFDRRWKRGG
jgi:hypothetical protein